MAKTILSEKQQEILSVLASEKNICKDFYLTGGTTLAEFYLQHRLSEDLDFFSEKEFDSQFISVFLKKNIKRLGIKKVEYQQSFNRNLFFLYTDSEVIKTEFTFFPFSRIEKKTKRNTLSIDSLTDIAANKIFTIYQKPRARDFIDLYSIIKKTNWTIPDLVKKAKIKFDWHIDYLQLSSQFLLAQEVKDYPIMIKKIDHHIWQDFFIKEAKKLSKEILK